MKRFRIFSLALLVISIASCAEKETIEPQHPGQLKTLTNPYIKKTGKITNGTVVHSLDGGGGVGDDDPRPIRGIIGDVDGNGLYNVHSALHTAADVFIKNTYSSAEGQYIIDSVLPETYKLHFNLEGYEEFVKTIVVSGTASYFEVGTDTLMVQ